LKEAKDDNFKEIEVLKSFLADHPLEKGLPRLIDWGWTDKKISKYLRVRVGSLFIV
jgi:hypothetical protein